MMSKLKSNSIGTFRLLILFSALFSFGALNAQTCDGGALTFAGSSLTTEVICVDGVADMLSFSNNSTASLNYSYVVTDDAGNIIGLPPANTVEFDGAGIGTCLVYGVSYDGTLNAMAGTGMNISAITSTGGCLEMSSNVLTVVREAADGATVSTAAGTTTEVICVDGVADFIDFANTSSSPSLSYSYIVTDDAGNIIGLPPANTVEFDGAGPGVCIVYGASYTGTLNAMAGTGMNISAVTATGCFDLSDNSVSVIREAADGGNVSTVAGTTAEVICVDGVADAISFATSSASGSLNYSYIVTDDAGNIIGLPPANTVEFDGAGPGVCFVYGASYTGTLNAMAGTGMNISAVTATGCFDLSDNSVSVTREAADGGTVTTAAGTTSEVICIDGVADFIDFATTSTAGSLNYSYIVTDDAGNIIGLPPANTVEFDGAGVGTCIVYGASYTGTLNAMAGTGMNISAVTATGCFDLSDNSVSIIRDAPDGGMVKTIDHQSYDTVCVDGVADFISFKTTCSASDLNYSYIVTDDAGNIIGLPPGNTVEFDGAGVGTCLVYGISYLGTLNATAGIGQNISTVTATGCYELSNNFVTIVRDTPDGGMVRTLDNLTTDTICVDGVADFISFKTTCTAADLNYSYIVTDDAGNIIGLPPGNTVEFDGAGVGTCFVYGISYAGTLNATAGTGMNISMVTASDCYELSGNAVSIVRIDCSLAIPAPENLVSATSATAANLYWNPVPGAVNYRLCGRVAGTSMNFRCITNATNSKSIGGLAPNKTYEWYVMTNAGGGLYSGHSSHEVFTTASARTASDEVDPFDQINPASVNIFPVPANEQIQVNYTTSSTEAVNIILTDMVGKQHGIKQLNAGNSSVSFDVRELPTGLYFVMIQDGQNSITKRVQVVH